MGSHGSALDRNSVYQAVLSFNNGSGFCYFSSTSDITPRQGASATDFAFIGSTTNRAVIYYKGVSYVGSCFGTSDYDARFIEAIINATSELGFSATNSQQNNNGQQQTTSVTASNIIVQNNKSFTVNGAFEAKITQSAPVMRFRGKGELAFISPTGASSINTLAYQSYSGLIGAIISFVANSQVTNANSIDYAQVFGGAQTAVKNALTDLKTNFLATGGIDDSYDEAVVEKIRVSGTRRYL